MFISANQYTGICYLTCIPNHLEDTGPKSIPTQLQQKESLERLCRHPVDINLSKRLTLCFKKKYLFIYLLATQIRYFAIQANSSGDTNYLIKKKKMLVFCHAFNDNVSKSKIVITLTSTLLLLLFEYSEKIMVESNRALDI